MWRQDRNLLRGARRRARGFTLFDAIIAMALLAFGLLGVTRLQTRTLAQATESQSRLTAVQLGDELLSSVLIDSGNYACYTLPATGACGSTQARTNTTDWNSRVTAALPSGAASAVYDSSTSRMKVTITWTGKSASDTRTYEATNDVR